MRKLRVVIAKPGLDGHDRGAKVIARALRDAGMEVIYTGLRQTPEMIASAALQEDADCIGLSILSGAHNHIAPRLMELLAEKGLDDVLVVIGGIIPDVDIPKLKAMGVKGIFLPGRPMQDIIGFINANVRSRVSPPPGPADTPKVPYNLLLPDDSVTIQRVIELTFADEDVTVVAVSDGDQAIERLEAAPPDIVLADIGMPGKNGYEVAQYMRRSPKLAHIPVVLLTGAFEPVDQARAIDCDGVLAKPFEPQLVIGRVKELLARRHRAAHSSPPASEPGTGDSSAISSQSML